MSMKLVKQVPTGEEIKELYPLSQELKDIKAKRDEEIRKIFTGEDKRFIGMVLGIALVVGHTDRSVIYSVAEPEVVTEENVQEEPLTDEAVQMEM